MDALSDVLRIMRLKGGVFLHGEFRHPWCISVKVAAQSCSRYLGETAHVIPYHYVLEGRVGVRMPDSQEIALETGESVMFPHNDQHLLGTDLARAPVQSRDYVARPIEGGLLEMKLDGDGPRTRIVCGFLGSEAVRGNPIMNALPSALRLNMRDGSAGAWIGSMFYHAAEQIAAGHLGSEVLMSRLSELLFVEAIQRYVDTHPETSSRAGWRVSEILTCRARWRSCMRGSTSRGRWTRSVKRLGCRARRWPIGSARCSACRRCNISPTGVFTLPGTSSSTAASRSRRSRRKSDTSRKPRSRGLSSA